MIVGLLVVLPHLHQSLMLFIIFLNPELSHSLLILKIMLFLLFLFHLFLISSLFVLDGLADQSVGGCSLYVIYVQTSEVLFIPRR